MTKFLLAVAIIATMAVAQTSAIWDGTADTDWYDNQTEFTINTAEQLAGLAQLVNNGENFLGKTITLGANIMLNDTTNWQNWENNPPAPANSWVEFGGFEGTFDGNGYLVSGVYINTYSGWAQGLFRSTNSNATIKNLGVIASFVGGHQDIGGLVGINHGTIINSFAGGNVRSNNYVAGGLVGRNMGTGIIRNSFARGNVNAMAGNAGGLVGWNDGTINNSYSTGGVISISDIGGLVGVREEGIVFNSFYDEQTSGLKDSDDNRGTPKTTAEMKNRNTFTDWNFTNIWGINPNINNGYPYLRSFVDVRVDWDEQTAFIYNGEEQAPTATASFVSNGREVPIKISGAINAGEHTATAVLETANPNINLLNDTIRFTINPKPITRNMITPIPAQPQTGFPIEPPVEVKDGEKVLVENVDYTILYDGNLIVADWVRIIGIGNYTGTASRQFIITPPGAREVRVEWGERREFVFNRMVQHPEWSIGNSGINPDHIEIINARSEVGKHRAFVMIIPEFASLYSNIEPVNTTINYEITRRPLNVVMRDRNGNRRDTITTEENIRVSGDLFDYIENILGYSNFATDTINNRTDDESVLRGSPKFGIQNRNNSRNLRNNDIILERNIPLTIGERFIVIVDTEDITADNYTILQRDIHIEIGERFITLATDPRDDITSVANVRRADNRYGIRFAVNPVSDRAEISVVLPASTASTGSATAATEVSVVIYDMVGNVVFECRGTACLARGVQTQIQADKAHLVPTIIWDLRNSAGRFVANGTYLVIAEARDRNGRVYTYSARLGVKR